MSPDVSVTVQSKVQNGNLYLYTKQYNQQTLEDSY